MEAIIEDIEDLLNDNEYYEAQQLVFTWAPRHKKKYGAHALLLPLQEITSLFLKHGIEAALSSTNVFREYINILLEIEETENKENMAFILSVSKKLYQLHCLHEKETKKLISHETHLDLMSIRSEGYKCMQIVLKWSGKFGAFPSGHPLFHAAAAVLYCGRELSENVVNHYVRGDCGKNLAIRMIEIEGESHERIEKLGSRVEKKRELDEAAKLNALSFCRACLSCAIMGSIKVPMDALSVYFEHVIPSKAHPLMIFTRQLLKTSAVGSSRVFKLLKVKWKSIIGEIRDDQGKGIMSLVDELGVLYCHQEKPQDNGNMLQNMFQTLMGV
ncbi:Golgi to ER traffic protein 4 like protein [Aduncisulcus paluster]|uniref:Golgi to ER traffic protein 4 like protein n=1 Tax=Aduncisulcus paluster TaxID=2918883 RepID=A0ABQ5JX76_9EUKA|nr:Golgi to ER traffic protein 4 like protein [Aduncisulcus paluster]